MSKYIHGVHFTFDNKVNPSYSPSIQLVWFLRKENLSCVNTSYKLVASYELVLPHLMLTMFNAVETVKAFDSWCKGKYIWRYQKIEVCMHNIPESFG